MRPLFFVFGFLLASAGCVTTLQNPMTTAIPLDFSKAQIEDALKKAALTRDWNLVKKGDGTFTGTHTARQHAVTVVFEFDQDNLRAKYVDSREMRYDGVRIHSKYHKWVNGFFHTFHTALRGTPAAETSSSNQPNGVSKATTNTTKAASEPK